jgi:stress response protein SCP2
MNNEIYIRRQRKVHLEKGTGSQWTVTMAALLKNMEPLGYTLAPDVLKVAETLSTADLKVFHDELIEGLKRMVGAHVDHQPMYPNFPQQVMDASAAELYFNAMFHYFGDWIGARILPRYRVEERSALQDRKQLKVIGLGSREEFERMATRLLSAKTSISKTDQEDLTWFAKHYGDDLVRLIPDVVPLKENVAVLGCLCIRHTSMADAILAKHIRTATDVLRLAVALSDGDVSLAENTVFKSFRKAERRALLGLLERIGGGAEDMLRHAEVWKRLGERLHPGDFAKRYPKTLDAFQVVRDALPFQTFNRSVEQALRQQDVDGALAHLRTRPGELARRIDHLSRLGPNAAVADAFEEVASKVSAPVLLQVLAHFRQRNAPKELRTFFPKGDVGKVRAITNELAALPEQLCQRLVTICEHALRERYRQLPPLGRVFVDERLRGYTVPAGLRSASKALHTVARGSRIALPEGGTLRFFIWWTDGEHRTDIDLSAIGLGDGHQFIADIAYYNLREIGGHHSGDITSAPEGAAEFIDVDIDAFRQRHIRYLVMCVNAYTHQAFCDLPECFAGFMMRQAPNSGEIFEARTVENKFDLTGRTRFALPMIIDLAERQVVWTDLALTNQPGTHNNVYNNLSSITLVAKAMTSLVKPDLYTLFRLHAEARGQLVAQVDQADTIFGIDNGITPTDTDRIVGEFL